MAGADAPAPDDIASDRKREREKEREKEKKKSPSSYSPGGWLGLAWLGSPSPSALFIIISFIFCFHSNEEMRERLLVDAAPGVEPG